MSVKELITQLGFDPENPTSLQRHVKSFYKELRDHIDSFQKKSKDNIIPRDDPASAAAIRCAKEFCDARAETIWPHSGKLPGPTWPKDESSWVISVCAT